MNEPVVLVKDKILHNRDYSLYYVVTHLSDSRYSFLLLGFKNLNEAIGFMKNPSMDKFEKHVDIITKSNLLVNYVIKIIRFDYKNNKFAIGVLKNDNDIEDIEISNEDIKLNNEPDLLVINKEVLEYAKRQWSILESFIRNSQISFPIKSNMEFDKENKFYLNLPKNFEIINI